MKRPTFQFKVRTWLQLGLLPALTGIAIWIGWGLYDDLRRIILERFDRQLTSPSVVVAAFIDVEEHQWLAENRNVRALTYVPGEDVFFALADYDGVTKMVQFSPEDGRLPAAGITLNPAIVDLAFDITTGSLMGLTEAGGQLVRVNPNTGGSQTLIDAPNGVHEIASAGEGGVWIKANDVRLWQVGLGTDAPGLPIPEIYDPPRLVGTNPAGDALLWINAPDDELVWQNIEDGEIKRVPWTGEIDLPQELGYDVTRERWVAAQEKLWVVDLAANTEVPDSFVAAYGREDSDEYRRLMAPLIRIHARLGLTYLYTQVVEPPDRIRYVADTLESGTYSPLLSTDVLPAAEVEGITRLKAEGSLHFTDLQQWDQWGWLKSAFAPIFDEEDQVVAMTGTDFNASLIELSLRRSLLAVFLIGGFTLVIASGWSLIVSRWLQRPIENLKSGALDVAAGDFQSLTVSGSREVDALTKVFNEASAMMERSVENLTDEVNLLLRRRDRAEVQRVFVDSLSPPCVFEDDLAVVVEHYTAGVGGAIALKGDRRLIWWEETVSGEQSQKSLVRLGGVAGQVRTRFGSLIAPTDSPGRWPDHLRAVLALDLQKRTAMGWVKNPADPLPVSRDAERFTVGWSDSGPVLVLSHYELQEAAPL